MKAFGMLALAALLMPVAVSAQDSDVALNPITNLIKQQVGQYGGLQVAAAEAMPEAKYSYQPTPETRTFGQLILHVAQFNNLMCNRISGFAAPDIKGIKDTDGKDKLLAVLKDSFDFCTNALDSVDDSTLGRSAGKLGPNMTLSRGSAIMILGEDWFDHYSAMALYLRGNGIPPPSAKPAAGRK